jgi:hypothetical protein
MTQAAASMHSFGVDLGGCTVLVSFHVERDDPEAG